MSCSQHFVISSEDIVISNAEIDLNLRSVVDYTRFLPTFEMTHESII